MPGSGTSVAGSGCDESEPSASCSFDEDDGTISGAWNCMSSKNRASNATAPVCYHEQS